MINQENIQHLRELSWEEVFLFWYQNEGGNPDWQKLAQDRGFASWADWRLSSYGIKFGCPEAEWGLYSIENAGEVVSNFYGGPFSTWVERHYDGENKKSFAELVERSDILENEKINLLANDYPVNSKIICLDLNGKIYVVEGMHRCCALAMMYRANIKMPKNIEVAIGKSNLKELPQAGQAKPAGQPT